MVLLHRIIQLIVQCGLQQHIGLLRACFFFFVFSGVEDKCERERERESVGIWG